jgi:hypothetical protein
MSKNSILADTLAEIQGIKESISMNANHVLKSTLKEDLEAIVRKGLNEAEEDQPNDMVGDGNPTDQVSDVVSSDDIMSGDAGIDPTAGIDADASATEDGVEAGDPELIDLTDKPDDEVIKHYNLMSPTDEIEVVQTPSGGIQINIEPSGAEETGEMPAEMPSDMEPTEPTGEEGTEETGEMPTDINPEEGGEDDETKEKEAVYEIEISEEEEPTEVAEVTNNNAEKHEKNVEEDVAHTPSKAHMKHKEQELHESLVLTRKKLQTLMTENKNKAKELENVNALIKEFKNSESDYKSAIKNLKGQLQEVALFTSNLTYAVKLMTENSTTKDEKLDILKRFDSAKTMTESREVFNSLETLFNASKNTVEKTIEDKILEASKSSGSANLNESTVYQNPQISRMLDIIGKIK